MKFFINIWRIFFSWKNFHGIPWNSMENFMNSRNDFRQSAIDDDSCFGRLQSTRFLTADMQFYAFGKTKQKVLKLMFRYLSSCDWIRRYVVLKVAPLQTHSWSSYDHAGFSWTR
jgi:hypothetical protein